MAYKKIRQISLITLILIVSFSSVSLINYNYTTLSIHKELINSSLPLLRENIYSEIEKDLLNPLNIAGAMANDSFLKLWVLEEEENSDKITLYLQTLHDKYGFLSTFFVSQRTQNYYHHKGLLKKISPEDSHDIWYYLFKDSGQEYALDVDSDQASLNRLSIFINYRVEDLEGHFLGVTGVGIEMELFSQFLMDREEKYNRKIYLINDSGVIQAHTDETLIEKQNIKENFHLSEVSQQLLTNKNEPVNISVKTGRNRFLVTSRYIPEINWFLVVEQNETDAIKTARSNLIRTLLTGLITSILVSIICSTIINYYQNSMIKQATKDPLTGLNNRRGFEEFYDRAVYRETRYAISLSLILIDIDNFKLINDKFGHLKGDEILINIASLLKKALRPDDVIVRWGGDEFVILLEFNADKAEATGNRILNEVFAQSKISLSLGVTGHVIGESLDELISRADKAMYQAKRAGKNRLTRLDK